MLQIGALVDEKYKVLSEIGRGGMSIVYMAINEKANKTWAIKEVRKDGGKGSEVVKQGLIMEMNMLKKLKHPHLPSIIDVIDDEDTILIVMDYIEGNPLSKMQEEYGAQPQDHVIEWALQICDVLGYLHTRNPAIIYRDLKPANIMLKPDGNIMLIDFGTAREYKEKNIADTTCLGTVGYAAPEQFGGQGQTDARTDIYCLGATLYHLVTGCSPCEPPYEIMPIREINPTLSSGFEKIILKCTQRNPDDRYQSCAELMYALEHYEDADDLHRKKQVKKLTLFLACVFLTLLFATTSVWGYISAQNKKSENYHVILVQASDATLSQEERTQKYLEAVRTDPTLSDAYLDLTEMFLRDGEADGLKKEESAVFIQLQAGLNTTGNGRSGSIFPLEQLKSSNPQGYAQVCYEIGIAYWYDYEVASDRHTAAAYWFGEAKDRNQVARLYCDIGECSEQIKKFSGQNRTEKMYETYETLWAKLGELKVAADALGDNDLKLLVWPEMVEMISSRAQYFLGGKSIPAAELLRMLDTIEQDADRILSATTISEVKAIVETLKMDIGEARKRVAAADSVNP